MTRTSQMVILGVIHKPSRLIFFIFKIFPNAVKIRPLLEPKLAPPQIAQLATCLAPSFQAGYSPAAPPGSPWTRAGPPPGPGAHTTHLIGESSGPAF